VCGPIEILYKCLQQRNFKGIFRTEQSVCRTFPPTAQCRIGNQFMLTAHDLTTVQMQSEPYIAR